MVWKNYIVQQSDQVNPYTTRGSDLYGAYNSLLFDLFPVSEHYMVAPRVKRFTRSAGNHTIRYVVFKRNILILFVEIKTFMALNLPSARASADDKMHKILLGFSSDRLPQSKLIGISVMGTRFAMYEYTTNDRRIDPPRFTRSDILTDTAPKERWSDDIMEDSGEAKLKTLVNEVKEMALAIGGACEHYFLPYSCPFTDPHPIGLRRAYDIV
jgi:hypothetical protein